MSTSGPGEGQPPGQGPGDWNRPPEFGRPAGPAPAGPPTSGSPTSGWVPPPGQWGAPPPQGSGWGPPGPYGTAGYPPPGWGPAYVQEPPKNTGKSVAILVLGISSLITCLVVPGIVALVLAPGAKREIDASHGRRTGRDLIKAGVICSWISIGLAVLALVLFTVFLALIVNSDPTFRIETPADAGFEF
ncbi:MAG: DUF4190 domain-containing protein [Sporichthyaceae bacterium]